MCVTRESIDCAEPAFIFKIHQTEGELSVFVGSAGTGDLHIDVPLDRLTATIETDLLESLYSQTNAFCQALQLVETTE